MPEVHPRNAANSGPFAPRTRSRRSLLLTPPFLPFLLTWVLLCGFNPFLFPLRAQKAPDGTSDKVDVVLLVNSLETTAIRMGVAYRQRVPHSQVRQEVTRLAALTGGQLGSDLLIKDSSLRPKNLKRYPITTNASFTLKNVPAVVGGVPVLLPYLQAFQRWGTMEVLLLLPQTGTYQSVEQAENAAYRVRLLQKEGGVYRYEAVIRDHKGILPALPLAPTTPATTGSPPANGGSTPVATSRTGSGSLMPILLIGVGVVLIGGAGGYLLLNRRNQPNVSAP